MKNKSSVITAETDLRPVSTPKFFIFQKQSEHNSSGKRNRNTYSYGFRCAIVVKIFTFCSGK